MSDLLPPNATKQERAISLATARIGDIEVPIGEIYDADLCPINLLPWLAWAMNVENWDSGWTELQKRETIKNQFKVHQLKGTRGSVNRTADSFGVNVDLQEWFEQTPVGEPYTFIAQVSIPDAPIEQQLSIQKAILGAKPVRSTMDLRIISSATLQFEMIPILRLANFYRYQTTLN